MAEAKGNQQNLLVSKQSTITMKAQSFQWNEISVVPARKTTQRYVETQTEPPEVKLKLH